MLSKIYPHLSEKSSSLANIGQYVFYVSNDATKDLVKKEIENLYSGVEVGSVRIVNLPNKKRVFKRTKGENKRLKKAIVNLKKGSIPVFEGA